MLRISSDLIFVQFWHLYQRFTNKGMAPGLSKNKILQFSFTKVRSHLLGLQYTAFPTLPPYMQNISLLTKNRHLEIKSPDLLSPLTIAVHSWQSSDPTDESTWHYRSIPTVRVRIWASTTSYRTCTLHGTFFCLFPNPYSNTTEGDRDVDWEVTAEFTVSDVNQNTGDTCRYFQNNTHF